MSEKVYFVSGGNKGIGFALVKEISSRPNTKVITTARHPEKAVELQQLVNERGNIYVLKYEATLKESSIEVGKKVGELVDGIDVLILNAGVGDSFYTVLDTPEDVFRKHYDVNVLGPIFLYQSLYSHLIKRKTRHILFVSSSAGLINNFTPMSLSAYGQSKAALNYSAKEISFELGSEGFIVVCIHPGGVDTDPVKHAIKTISHTDPELAQAIAGNVISPDDSAKQIVSILDNLTKEDNGTFINNTGERFTW